MPRRELGSLARDESETTLLFHRNVNALKTEVSVKDAVATLRGEADSESQKELTTEYAKDVTGSKT